MHDQVVNTRITVKIKTPVISLLFYYTVYEDRVVWKINCINTM